MLSAPLEERDMSLGALTGWLNDISQFSWNGSMYSVLGNTTYGNQEPVVVRGEGHAYCSNGVVSAVVGRRIDLFSQASFAWKRYGAGPKPMASDLYTNAALLPLDDPVDLLTWMEADAAWAGNAFIVRDGDALRRLPPHWVTIVIGSNTDSDHPEHAWDARIAGYIYDPPEGDREVFMADEVCHYAPKPDQAARFRGMSYLRPVLRQVANQNAYAGFLSQYWSHSAPQPLDARVLTPAGWSTMGAMRVGDHVIGRDGKPHRVVGVYPQGEQDIYRVNLSGGASTECTADHVWHVESEHDRLTGSYRTMTLKQLMDRGIRYPSDQAKWSVPMIDDAVQFDDPGPLPIDPYLLGALLGDGSFRGAGKMSKNGVRSGSASLSAHADDADELEAALVPLLPSGTGITRRDRGGWSEFYFRGPGGPRPSSLMTALDSLGLWGVSGRYKHIPDAYMRASVLERLALLQGLIDTDGHVGLRQGNLVRFDSTSEVLARQVADLAHGLGGLATVLPVPARRQWSVLLRQLPEWIVPCRLARKVSRYRPSVRYRGRRRYIQSVEFVGRKQAQCIKVDVADSLYVTDDYILTHNTPNLVIKFPPEQTRSTIEMFRDVFNQRHEGAGRAFRTAFLGGGADPVVVGANLKDLAAEEVTAHEFATICAAAGVPPIVVTIVPGLESASTYANFASAHRAFADLTVRPLWKRAAIKLRPLITPQPADAELWYDVRGVSALQEDAKDDAAIAEGNARTIRTLVDGGFDPDSVVEGVIAGDLSRIKHTGLTSVQLLPPGASQTPAKPKAA